MKKETIVLWIQDLEVSYGNVKVLHGVNLEIMQKEVVALLGANGAGKTTLLRAISGLVKPVRGTIELEGHSISSNKPHKIVEIGVIQVPEGRGIFTELTVLQNLALGAYCRKDMVKVQQDFEQVYQWFPVVKQRLNQRAITLSGGEQQMLAFARAFLAKPKVLLLDEPSQGLAPLIVRELFSRAKEMSKHEVSVVIVEQNVSEVLKVADRGYLMQTGRIALEGTPESLLDREDIASIYLGARVSPR